MASIVERNGGVVIALEASGFVVGCKIVSAKSFHDYAEARQEVIRKKEEALSEAAWLRRQITRVEAVADELDWLLKELPQ